MFALVRLEPPILLRQRCDRANRRGTEGNGFWGGTDTRRAAAYTSYDRDFAAGGGAVSGARPALQGTGGAGRAERRQDWDLAYRIRGTAKTRRLSLGRTTDVSLEQARERANELTSAARGGRDLIAEEDEAQRRGGLADHGRVADRPLSSTAGCRPPAHRQDDREPSEAHADADPSAIRRGCLPSRHSRAPGRHGRPGERAGGGKAPAGLHRDVSLGPVAGHR